MRDAIAHLARADDTDAFNLQWMSFRAKISAATLCAAVGAAQAMPFAAVWRD